MADVIEEISYLSEIEQERILREIQEDYATLRIDDVEYSVPRAVRVLVDRLADELEELREKEKIHGIPENKGN